MVATLICVTLAAAGYADNKSARPQLRRGALVQTFFTPSRMVPPRAARVAYKYLPSELPLSYVQ